MSIFSKSYTLGFYTLLQKFANEDPVAKIVEAMQSNPNLDVVDFITKQQWPKNIMMRFHPDLLQHDARLHPELKNKITEALKTGELNITGNGMKGYTPPRQQQRYKNYSTHSGFGGYWEAIFKQHNDFYSAYQKSKKSYWARQAENTKINRKVMGALGLGLAATIPFSAYFNAKKRSDSASKNRKKGFAKAASTTSTLLKNMADSPLLSSVAIGGLSGGIGGYAGTYGLKKKMSQKERLKRSIAPAIGMSILGGLTFGTMLKDLKKKEDWYREMANT